MSANLVVKQNYEIFLNVKYNYINMINALLVLSLKNRDGLICNTLEETMSYP